jgi:glycosyltransferase involved in cell wall biosynthesis
LAQRCNEIFGVVEGGRHSALLNPLTLALSEKMNIVLINSSRRWIGEAAHCAALYEQLRRRGHRVSLVCRRGYEIARHAEQCGFTFHTLTMNGRFNGLSDLFDLLRLRAILKRERAQLIHCHRGKDHWLAATARLTLAQPPALVRTRHVVVPVKGHLANRWLFAHATDAVVAVSEKAKDSLRSVLPHMRRAPRVIYAAVDINEFNPSRRDPELRKELGVGGNDLLVGLIGRLSSIKGQSEFLRAAAAVAAHFPQAKFLLSGRGSKGRRQRLLNEARNLGISDRLIMLDYQPLIAPLIASLDVGVVASLGSEGSSRITLEYMASGVPIVATRVGGIPELVSDGETALLIPPGDADALAQGIEKLLASQSLRRQLSQAARARAEQCYTYDRFMNEVEELYRDVLATRPTISPLAR